MWNVVLKRLGIGAKPEPARLALALADVTAQQVDAVVNAADWTMLGGTGVDGAIHQAAGPELGAWIVERAMRLESCQAKSTPGFAMKAKWIVHVCSPTYDPFDVEERMRCLGVAYQACVDEAKRLGCGSLAFPVLGAGAFGWPKELAAQAAARALAASAKDPGSLVLIKLCAFDQGMFVELGRRMGLAGEVEGDPSKFAYHPGASALSGLSAAQIESYWKK